MTALALAETLEVLNPHTTIKSSVNDDSSVQKIERTYSEELVIGICSPIGSMKSSIIDTIQSAITSKYGYECEVIKLSTFITKHGKAFMNTGTTTSADKIRHLINQGNELREEYKSKALLAELAILDIFKKRAGDPSSEELEKLLGVNRIPELFDRTGEYENIFKSKRKCYIIDSIKTTEEVKLFRSIYRELFYFVSVFTPDKDRKENLTEKFISTTEAEEIMAIDSDEANNIYGQKVRDSFVLGDFFINVTRRNNFDVHKKIIRFLDIVFDTKIITPTVHETAMYHAKSAATNSACLSRQVGAAVTDASGKVLAVGWNDVPKFGGSLYQSETGTEGPENDARCMFRTYSADNKLIPGLGMCFNDHEKTVIANELTALLVKEGIIEEAKAGATQIALRGSKIKELIEYSRAVHAEMHAIITASQTSGASMKKAHLYCTTYPCHNCGRHIIAAGIEAVYYIEPYTKSLSTRLHSDAMTEDEDDTSKVRILMFEGVAPNRYLKFFSIHEKRKLSNGTAVTLSPEELRRIKPKTRLTLRALPVLEVQALHALIDKGFSLESKVR